MAQPQYGYGQQSQAYSGQNLNFYQSSFSGQPVSGTTTPFQAYSGGVQSNAYPGAGFSGGFVQPGVSGRMGESGGLRTGWFVYGIHSTLAIATDNIQKGLRHLAQRVMKVNHLYSKN
jgi:hypothetical protein